MGSIPLRESISTIFSDAYSVFRGGQEKWDFFNHPLDPDLWLIKDAKNFLD